MSFRFYLYGRGEPEVWELLQDPSFGGAVETLIRDGVTTADEEMARSAATHDLLKAGEGGWVAGPRLVTIPRRASRSVARAMGPHLDDYAVSAARTVDRLRGAYEACPVADDFPWDRVVHAVVAGMFLDLAVGSRLWLAGEVDRPYWQTVVWAFEEEVGRNPFGVQWVPGAGERSGFAQLWHPAVERPDLKIHGAAVSALRRVAEGSPSGLPPRELLYLRYLRLVRDHGGAPRATVPHLTEADMEERLLPVLWRGARELVEAAVVPALRSGIGEVWWSHRRDLESVHHALVRVVLELGVDRVVDDGLIPPFPCGSPEPSWGRWSWAEAAGHPTLVAGSFDEIEAAGAVAGQQGVPAGGER